MMGIRGAGSWKSKHRILIIDDDHHVGKQAAGALLKAGFEARFHHGPYGALDAIRTSRSDLVLLDVNMPKLDGASIVRLIREAFSTVRIRVVLFSSMEIGVLQRIASRIGACGAISKTCGDEELVAMVTELLGNSRANTGSA